MQLPKVGWDDADDESGGEGGTSNVTTEGVELPSLSIKH
jgi:hypothetical protein